jgi:preprotein translocase subunit YajC
MLYALIVLIAQVEEKAVEKGAEPGAGVRTLFDNPMLIFLAIGVMFIFIVWMPQQRKEKKQRESLLANLKKNDEVVTAAGIIGVVSNIKEGADEVTLKIDDNARIRVLKSTIIRVVTRETNKEGA